MINLYMLLLSYFSYSYGRNNLKYICRSILHLFFYSDSIANFNLFLVDQCGNFCILTCEKIVSFLDQILIYSNSLLK